MARLGTPDWITMPLDRYSEGEGRGARRLRIIRECTQMATSETGVRQATVSYLGAIGTMFAIVLFSSVLMRGASSHGQAAQITVWVWIPIAVFILAVAVLGIFTQAMIILRISTVMRGSPAPQAFLARHAWAKLFSLTAFALLSIFARMARLALFFVAWIPAARRLRHQGRLFEMRQSTYLGFACKTLDHGTARSAIKRGIAISSGRWGEGAREVPTLGKPLLIISLPLITLGGIFALLNFRALGLLTALLGISISGLVLTVCLGCYAIAIYVFAVGGPPAFGFRAEDLDAAFLPGPAGRPELQVPEQGPETKP